MLDKNTKGNEEIMEKLLTNSDQINEISNQIKKAVNQKEIIGLTPISGNYIKTLSLNSY